MVIGEVSLALPRIEALRAQAYGVGAWGLEIVGNPGFKGAGFRDVM